MSGLRPIPFSKRQAPKPRLSKPRVHGRRDERFYTDDEIAIIRRWYPNGGVTACLARLGPHRTEQAIYNYAKKLGLSGSRVAKLDVPADIDDKLRTAWPGMNGKKKGEVNALADRLGVPRWWLTKRLTKLGLTIPHRKEPPWTEADDALLARVPLHSPDKCSEIFREHGFPRSPTAIIVRAKRRNLSRRATRQELSATACARVLGVDIKWITAEIIRGTLPAVKRDDRRLPQQGGSAWDVKPSDFRQYIIDHLERIDFRKVDKFELVNILVTSQKKDSA